MKNYKVICGEYQHLTKTQLKYFKLALEYALNNNQNSVKVNRMEFYFDFENENVKIGTKIENTYTYKIVKTN